ncbi:hypothetical protein AFERRI_420138 [Acidithiobacillus ferrivorans]|uniref:Uncharacterized protein n=1 Tax=Acidithiobacillus ferrivorans TaxID=160808 RepID=A0A060UQX1_9PROT|nr:hypothetical protein AFERRI_420138 [Acidithiobacillus ferrivorans]
MGDFRHPTGLSSRNAGRYGEMSYAPNMNNAHRYGATVQCFPAQIRFDTLVRLTNQNSVVTEIRKNRRTPDQ